VPGKFYGALLLALAVLAGGGPAAVAIEPSDRLDRFRELATSQLGLAQIDADPSADAYREIYAVLDDEVVENLAAGGPFASLDFLQDRLDAFAEAWGGATLRLVRAGGLLVGAFVLDERSAANSVRVYGRLAGEGPALLTALYREGRPSVYVLPGAREGGALVAAWEGAPSGWGMRPLRVDLLRRDGDGVRVVWSTAELFADGLLARSWSVRGGDVRIRYEVRYPGWAPGCDGQTEQEDVYRVASAAAVVRIARQEHDAWHRDLHAAVGRLVSALAAGDETTLTALVPDRTLRSLLPSTLRLEPACDAREGAGGDAVSVAAAAGRQPWVLTFRRVGARWRLTGASRVLQ
jgi:hypothetical protein